MSQSTQSVVKDYLNNLLFDLTLQEPVYEYPVSETITPSDSIQTSQRLSPCFDPFQFMAVQHTFNRVQTWWVLLSILNIAKKLPQGRLKAYCLQQCQILLNQIDSQGS